MLACPKHQLDHANVHAIGEEAAGPFVPKIMPAEIDPPELLTIPGGAFPRGSRHDAVSEQSKGFPGRLEFGLVRARR
jgi:hypothetical protein